MGVTLSCYFVIFAFNLPGFLSFFPLIFFNLAAPLKYTLFIVVFLFWTDIFSLLPTSWEAIIFSYTQENYKQLTSVPTSHTATYQFCFLSVINSLSLSDSHSQHKDSIIWVIFPFFFFFAHYHIFKGNSSWGRVGEAWKFKYGWHFNGNFHGPESIWASRYLFLLIIIANSIV